MKRKLWPRARTLAGVAVLAVLAWKLGADAFLDGLRVIDLTAVLAALAIGLLTTAFSAWRWCVVARALGLRLRLPTAVADYYQALLLNAVLPAGVLGDVGRAVNHGRESGDVGRGVRAVVLERTAGQLVLFGLGGAVLLGQPALVVAVVHQLRPVPAGDGGAGAASMPVTRMLRPSLLAEPLGLLVALCALLVLGGLVTLAVSAVRARRARRAGGKGATGKGATGEGASGQGVSGQGVVARVLTDARKGLFTRKTWPAVLALSVGALLGHVSLFVVAARAAGSTASVVALVPLAVVALIVMGLPVNVGGWGPREAACALSFGAAGLGAAQGLTTAVVYGVLAMVACLPGAAVLAFRRAGRGVRRRPGADAEPVPAEGERSVPRRHGRQLPVPSGVPAVLPVVLPAGNVRA